ncbi:TIR domain-containing protein [Microbulbifer magnicolonia]|uniref:TIR domain-containing protein n=1 Tax=Microbulbifer magnicolonia TaxID=3109744 RepID=UPI002B4178F6|nr:TIR domain-containing protein [Microbulbifer sp. GG15]
MAKKPIFFSFHYAKDAMRVQQIRNIGALEGNTPVNANDWETVKRGGDRAIKNWIDDSFKYKRCIIVLIGEETHDRPWVRYEIEKAWNDGKPIFGIYIHNLKCPRFGKSRKGINPFTKLNFKDGTKLSSVVNCYDPNPNDAYNDIANNIESWVDKAILQRQKVMG